ncbi:helix-turn-helix domain-containing protein [Paenibacillus sp. GCM10012306]|uniref:helix-turn-helix domain-containing protein n=1 Tax=Paenibacillus sp. GCM10012306 TaxID=3317342 RepID=UPI003606A434
MAQPSIRAWHEKIRHKTSQPLNIIISSLEEGYPAHWHKELEIVYILGEGMQIGIGGEIYTLRTRDILLINSCEVHQNFANPNGCAKIILQLDKLPFGVWGDLIFNQKILLPHLRPAITDDQNNSWQVTLHGELERLILDIHREWEGKSDGFELIITARMHDLMALLLRLVPREVYSKEALAKRKIRLEQLDRLEGVLNHIENHPGSEMTLKQAADISGYSIYHFTRLFKEATGVTFVDYINIFRANYAGQLLLGSDMSITEAAYRAGFNSIETFNRVFKKVNGCTPTLYRSKI